MGIERLHLDSTRCRTIADYVHKLREIADQMEENAHRPAEERRPELVPEVLIMLVVSEQDGLIHRGVYNDGDVTASRLMGWLQWAQFDIYNVCP
jgi:hypothetical protein